MSGEECAASKATQLLDWRLETGCNLSSPILLRLLLLSLQSPPNSLTPIDG